jgi:V/A-type H+/Na+-transporting ATPase subunit A
MSVARVSRAAGALVEARPLGDVALYELAYVGDRALLAEVIRVEGERATLQVFEDTNGLALGEPVTATGAPLEAQLGPGLLGSLLDGIGRPLDRMAARAGDFIPAGASVDTLDTVRRWTFRASVAPGAEVSPGDELGTVTEREDFVHRILVPPGVSGRVARLGAGEYGVNDAIGALEDGTELRLSQRWPMRVPRPIERRLSSDRPFVTGQRVLDFLFPVAEGGSAAVPGGFGTGKTVIEHSLAKFADADLVVFVGCGERGNEMAEVVQEFPKLTHPRTGRPIMSRAVLVANTSNMPVAARESSIYLGMTIAEYYRDQGYRVALMIDSVSRWAEALREISARLQEMPGEEGYPTSLSARFGSFLERAGRVQPLGAGRGTGAVTIIGAVSPPGGDFSEPVTQAALRVVGTLWALDADLAHARHFPAVDWGMSYSLYAPVVAPWFAREAGGDWTALRTELMSLLQRERELRDIAGLIGPDALADGDRLLMDVAALARELFLRQSANDPNDATSSVVKTLALARACVELHRVASAALADGAAFALLDLGASRRAIRSLRDAAESDVLARSRDAMAEIARLRGKRGESA